MDTGRIRLSAVDWGAKPAPVAVELPTLPLEASVTGVDPLAVAGAVLLSTLAMAVVELFWASTGLEM